MPSGIRPHKKAQKIVENILGKPSNHDADPKKSQRLSELTDKQDTRNVRGA